MSLHDSFVASGNSPTRSCDFVLEGHGSVFLLRPQNENAIAWLEEKVGSDNGYQPYWPTVVIEHRYISHIVSGIKNDGFEVRQ